MIPQILYKLEWSSGGEWSVSLKPAECTELLAHIGALENGCITQPKRKRPHPGTNKK